MLSLKIKEINSQCVNSYILLKKRVNRVMGKIYLQNMNKCLKK